MTCYGEQFFGSLHRCADTSYPVVLISLDLAECNWCTSALRPFYVLIVCVCACVSGRLRASVPEPRAPDGGGGPAQHGASEHR